MADLEALPVPAGEARSLEAFTENARATIEPAEQAAAALHDGDAPKLDAASRRGLRATTHFNKSAIEYGFLVCGRGAATEIW